MRASLSSPARRITGAGALVALTLLAAPPFAAAQDPARDAAIAVRTTYVWQPGTFTAEPAPVVGTDRAAFEKFESVSTKENVLKHLKEGYAYGKQAVEGVDPAKLVGTRKYFGRDVTTVQTAFFMSGDLHEHLGQLIAYARVNGVKPPWSR